MLPLPSLPQSLKLTPSLLRIKLMLEDSKLLTQHQDMLLLNKKTRKLTGVPLRARLLPLLKLPKELPKLRTKTRKSTGIMFKRKPMLL